MRAEVDGLRDGHWSSSRHDHNLRLVNFYEAKQQLN